MRVRYGNAQEDAVKPIVVRVNAQTEINPDEVAETKYDLYDGASWKAGYNVRLKGRDEWINVDRKYVQALLDRLYGRESTPNATR